MNFCVLPAGAWGTAIAIHLNRTGHRVTLVPRTMDEALEMASSRRNDRYFPDHELPMELQIGLELTPSLMEAEVCILACPSKFLRSVCREIRAELGKARNLRAFIVLCKGMEEGTNELPCDIVAEELPEFDRGVLSGPTFASQVAAGQPSAIVLAYQGDEKLRDAVQAALSSDTLRIYTSADLVGVELGACMKNVYAVASGMCDGLGLRDNSKAALLTRALHEMVKVGTALGGKTETFYGLSGFGDLILTCNGQESRNRTFGQLFAEGVSVKELLEERNMTVEGYRTSRCFHEICEEKGIEAPILEQIYRVLFTGQDVKQAIPALMGRRLKAEAH